MSEANRGADIADADFAVAGNDTSDPVLIIVDV
jgi:hypothetical protein